MIVVKVELWSAVTGKKTELGVMKVVNTNDGTLALHNYNAEVMRKPDFKAVTRAGRVTNWRRDAKTIWQLVGALLKNMGYVD